MFAEEGKDQSVCHRIKSHLSGGVVFGLMRCVEQVVYVPTQSVRANVKFTPRFQDPVEFLKCSPMIDQAQDAIAKNRVEYVVVICDLFDGLLTYLYVSNTQFFGNQ